MRCCQWSSLVCTLWSAVDLIKTCTVTSAQFLFALVEQNLRKMLKWFRFLYFFEYVYKKHAKIAHLYISVHIYIVTTFHMDVPCFRFSGYSQRKARDDTRRRMPLRQAHAHAHRPGESHSPGFHIMYRLHHSLRPLDLNMTWNQNKTSHATHFLCCHTHWLFFCVTAATAAGLINPREGRLV